MNKLYGDIIDIIRREIISIIDQKGVCTVPNLALNLMAGNSNRFHKGNWAGFPKVKTMLEAGNKFFTLYYRDEKKTDLCVRITDTSSLSLNYVENLQFSEYIKEIFNEDRCKEFRTLVGSMEECFSNAFLCKPLHK